MQILPKHQGGVVLNYDDSDGRRMAEHCIRTGKVLINPIIDWEEEDVWEFLNGNGIEHCCLYDEGYTRLGCIGCPMKSTRMRKEDFKRWYRYARMYKKAFQRMIDERKKRGLNTEAWLTPDDVMYWWLSK